METKAIIYARVSTSAQNTDRQVTDLQAYAQGNGYKVQDIFTEQISGARSKVLIFTFRRNSLTSSTQTDSPTHS